MKIPFRYGVRVCGWTVATLSGVAEIVAAEPTSRDPWQLATIELDATRDLPCGAIRSGSVALPDADTLTMAMKIWLLGGKREEINAAWAAGKPLGVLS